MGTSRTWYVSCSPRSPEKIAAELALLAQFDGLPWWEKDAASGALVNQIAFARELQHLESFEGRISQKVPELSARDRLAPIQTYGFAFVDSDGRIRITDAGWRLIGGAGVHELFLTQMLKWQYPSWQHGGNPKTRSRYPPVDQLDIFPFVEVLRTCRSLDGLRKEEIAIFLLPVLNRREIPGVIRSISEFRAELGQLHGVDRKDYIRRVHRERFASVYAADIQQGKISTRESRTETVDEFLAKKMRNSLDVADAVVRYFRYTGLFTLSADFHRLIISPLHAKEVDRILDEMEFPLVECFTDVEQFYGYLGNPDLPVLPWERRAELRAKATRLGIGARRARELSIAELKEAIMQAESEAKHQRLIAFSRQMQAPTATDDIVTTFRRVLDRDVIDPPLFLEWNTWRAMISMDDCTNVHPNFTLDEDLQPFSGAPGNVADIEVEYNESFIALVEVTMSQGARQYDSEGEPVTRHIGRYQSVEKRRQSPRPVYGLFMAPRIDSATRDYFYVHIKHLANPDFGGHLNIVPLSVDQFVDVFLFCRSLPTFSRFTLQDLFERIVGLKHATESAAEWEGKIPAEIDAWKRHWQALSATGQVTSHDTTSRSFPRDSPVSRQ